MSGNVVKLHPDQEQEIDYEALRQRALRLVEEMGVRPGVLAKATGYSQSSVSHFLSGRGRQRPGVAEALVKVIERLEAEALGSTEAAPATQPRKVDLDFILTEDARRVMGICEASARERAIGVVVGHAGGGKTTALQEYFRKNPTAVYFRADVTLTGRNLLEELAELVGADPTGGSLRSLLRRIVYKLKAHPRLIIVDEVDLLIRNTVRPMEMLRTIYDEAKCGMVLCGMPRLKLFLVKGPSLKENLAQLYSRVGFMCELRGIDRAEALEILKDLPLTDSAREELVGMAGDHMRGGLRRMVTVLRRALDLSKGDLVTREIIQAAGGLTLR